MSLLNAWLVPVLFATRPIQNVDACANSTTTAALLCNFTLLHKTMLTSQIRSAGYPKSSKLSFFIDREVMERTHSGRTYFIHAKIGTPPVVVKLIPDTGFDDLVLKRANYERPAKRRTR